MESGFILGWLDPKILSLSLPSSLPAGVHGFWLQRPFRRWGQGPPSSSWEEENSSGIPGAKHGRSTERDLFASRALAWTASCHTCHVSHRPGDSDVADHATGSGQRPMSTGDPGSAAEAQKHRCEPPTPAPGPPQTQSCYDRHGTHRCNVQAPGLNSDGQ